MDGLLIVDKPAGLTSHDVVARARRALREKRVGHTGTLDPFATGVLVLLVGRATRLAQFLAGAEKEYVAVVRLGHATDTGDLTGTPLPAPPGAPAPSDLMTLDESEYEAALARLRGEIEQTPPMYSAKKVEGKRLYELARRGETVERKSVRVRVSEFEVAPGELFWLRRNEDGTCDLRARVVCSAGTYVRALAESLGELLGTGAHLAALRRTRAGDFGLERSVTLERLQALADEGRVSEILVTMKAALSRLPSAHLSAREAESARHGAAVTPRDADSSWADGAHVSMLDAGGELLAVGAYDATAGVLRPRVVVSGGENKS
ncbi:MAG TPA: tRNA pseudouridine(55) synthase TruB [Pyrinomonadaceae bacterium]|nr:tRNA pseudouridine(55) synthase TruB [Pyrinomonadaceae bacterium]